MRIYHLKNGRILNPATGIDAYADLRIREGRIAEIGAELSPEAGETAECATARPNPTNIKKQRRVLPTPRARRESRISTPAT